MLSVPFRRDVGAVVRSTTSDEEVAPGRHGARERISMRVDGRGHPSRQFSWESFIYSLRKPCQRRSVARLAFGLLMTNRGRLTGPSLHRTMSNSNLYSGGCRWTAIGMRRGAMADDACPRCGSARDVAGRSSDPIIGTHYVCRTDSCQVSPTEATEMQRVLERLEALKGHRDPGTAFLMNSLGAGGFQNAPQFMLQRLRDVLVPMWRTQAKFYESLRGKRS